MIGLNFAQPFLITSLTNYVREDDPSKDDGYGLIGAFALVFGLKAVSLNDPLISNSTSSIKPDKSRRSSTVSMSIIHSAS